MIRILVVEDEFIIAESIIQTLEELGYQTLGPASSYGEALEILADDLPDLILLDI